MDDLGRRGGRGVFFRFFLLLPPPPLVPYDEPDQRHDDQQPGDRADGDAGGGTGREPRLPDHGIAPRTRPIARPVLGRRMRTQICLGTCLCVAIVRKCPFVRSLVHSFIASSRGADAYFSIHNK